MSVLSDSQEKGNFRAYALGQQAQASPYTAVLLNPKRSCMHALNTVLKKYIEREVTFIFNDLAEYFPLTAILHSWTRIPQVLFWIITNCITDVNLPWQQPNRCKVWCHFYSTSTLYICYVRVQTEESQPNF